MSRKRLVLVAFLAATPFLLFAAVRGCAAVLASILERRFPPPGRLISVGDRKLHLYCMGESGPAVVIETGIGTDWVAWRLVVPRLLEFSRVCVYDRAGYGWSEAGPWPRTAQRITGELHTLLSKSGLQEPYILVGHSFGGYIARTYASQYRQSLQGVVLVDPSHENNSAVSSNVVPAPTLSRRLLELIPPLGTQRLKRLYDGDKALPAELRSLPRGFQARYLIGSPLPQLRTERNEIDSLPETRAQMHLAPFPADLPLTVITAGNNFQERGLHADLVRSSKYGKQIIAEHSGHMVSLDRPDLIVVAVRELAQPSR